MEAPYKVQYITTLAPGKGWIDGFFSAASARRAVQIVKEARQKHHDKLGRDLGIDARYLGRDKPIASAEVPSARAVGSGGSR